MLNNIIKFFTGINLNYIFIAIIAIFLGIVIIPNVSAIAEKFGFETRTTLKAKVETEKKNTDIALSANKNLKDVTDIFDKTGTNKVEVIDSVNTNVNNNTDKSTNIINKRKVKIEKIKTQSKIVAASIDPKLKQAMELSGESLERVQASEINALSMLEAYCEYNKDENCKPLTKII